MPFSLPIAGLHERVRAAARAEFDRNGRHRVVQLEHQSVARRVRPPRTFNHNSSELYLNDELYFGGSVLYLYCALVLQVHLSATSVARLASAGAYAHTAFRLRLARRLHWCVILLDTYCTRTAQYTHISNVQMQVVAT